MRGRSMDRRTCFLQQRCTNWQLSGTSHRSASFKSALLQCVYAFFFFSWLLDGHHTVPLQGWYNLGVLAEEGFRLPLSILTEVGLSQLYLADRSVLLSALYRRCVQSVCVCIRCESAAYCPHCISVIKNNNNCVFSSKRCRDSENTDSYLPCSLALYSVYLQSFQKDYSAVIKVSAMCQIYICNQRICFKEKATDMKV